MPQGYNKIMGTSKLIGDYPDVFCYRMRAGRLLSPKVNYYAYLLIFWNSIAAFAFTHESRESAL